ncbi:MAG TPA: DUF5680 domain-containing protein [Candidatus Bathyarchaeia archaeon]|nr:DUF5680 domain-containing protein [Candidatus Bathyarchaeia archaeon]
MNHAFHVTDLEQFIVQAKKNTYVGSGTRLLPYRLHSKDLQFTQGDWIYHDSYFGESDFIGQEVVYFQKKPVWAMNYFGYVLQSERITSHTAGPVIKKSLSLMYEEGRFLGAFEHQDGTMKYVDTNQGDVQLFTGKEWIEEAGAVLYELVYHGGILKA